MQILFLQSSQAQDRLSQLSQEAITPQNHLSIATALRKLFSAEQAHSILEQVVLRQKAVGKFSRAGQMFFERAALEQASGEIISRHRATRYANVGDWIADLGCSIGGDALALAQMAPVMGVDRDATRLQLARHNVSVYGQGAFQPVQADLLEFILPQVAALFFDPARRDVHGRRLHDPAQYQPPLPLLSVWRQRVANAGVKLSPGIAYETIPSLAEAEVEFIALDYELKEAMVWYGDLRSDKRRRATILPAGHTLTEADGDSSVPIRPVARYLYEPNPAILRAGLVTHLGSQLDLAQIDPDIAYLSADHKLETPFARCHEILDVLPFQLKRLRSYLRERKVGRVTIKKRGSPLDVEQLRQQLRLKGSQSRLLFLTRVGGQPIVLVGRELSR